ncbi:MAG: cytochrome c [Ignavibacteria bacterium]|nr:MAG: cytochrome c [Ignavibacteria bacterium]
MKSMFTSTIQVSLRPFCVYIDPRSILMGARLRLLKYWGMSCSLHLIAIVTVFVLASSLLGQTTGTGDTSVTAVRGESWLLHSRRSFGETNMGKTWNLGPPPPDPGMELPPWQLNLSPGFPAPIVTLHGSDLYRMTCQGCHKESGQGAPPEINSVIDPVRATSVAAITARMKAAGREMSRSDIASMAKESKAMLLQRLHVGEQLAAIPGAEKNPIAVKESSYRIGEHIVKSTCYVCPSATGPNPSPEQILKGAIPPLSSLTTRVSLSGFVRKVTNGVPIIMGTPPTYYRGHMPVYVYFSQDEAAAAYLYLIRYPPRP